MKKKITIYDIARELNLSPSTVSRALKDHYSIGKKTRDAVKDLAIRHGFRPNALAAGLRNNRTNTLGVITPWINRPFISSLISGIEQAASKAGYNVIISQSNDSYENEIANAAALFAARVEGLVVSLAIKTQNFDHFEKFIQNGIPLVFVDRVTRELNSDMVVIDNFKAGYAATEHLIKQGCKRIAHLGGGQHRDLYHDRQRGYLEALQKHNLPVDETLIIHSSLSEADGYQAANYLFGLANKPDGIFSANDTAAVSAIRNARGRGIKIPEELAIIGFNNDPLCLIVDPPLSTIFHPAVDMGIIAVKQVLKYKSHKDLIASETVVLKTELLTRASSQRKNY